MEGQKTAGTQAWIVTLGAGVIIALCLPTFFGFIAEKPGFRPTDPILCHIVPMDTSVVLFTVLYSSIALVLAHLFKDRARLLRAAQAYVILLLLRMASMFLFTLEPPLDLIPLSDPFTQLFYPDAEPFTKDLFFSGHTATVFLLFLSVQHRVLRALLLMVTMLVGVLVLVQHVHWTIDVLAAPIGSWIAWWISGRTFPSVEAGSV